MNNNKTRKLWMNKLVRKCATIVNNYLGRFMKSKDIDPILLFMICLSVTIFVGIGVMADGFFTIYEQKSKQRIMDENFCQQLLDYYDINRNN